MLFALIGFDGVPRGGLRGLGVAMAFMVSGIDLASPPIQAKFQTRYARLQIGPAGTIDSIVDRRSGQEYSPKGHPSPLLTLHRGSSSEVPTSASYSAVRHAFELRYPDGAEAIVDVQQKPTYLRFQLISVKPSDAADNIEWGPVRTTISKRMGDLIGVVRDDDWAIGMIGLDDNTIAGPPTDSDCYEMGYYVHSLDPKNHPAPAPFHEGQHFSLGGDGHSDVAFYSRPEEYFQQIFGNGATLEPGFGSSLSYHSRDRRKSYTYQFSFLPGFEYSQPRTQVSDPVAADFSNSAVALYACPDQAGLSVIESVLLSENLPHPTVDGKWIRDPASFKPDIAWSGPHDKLIEYADALGLKAVQDEGQGEYYADPIDHWSGPRVGFSGNHTETYKQFTTECAQHGILYGLHTLCLFIQPDKSDVHPIPNEHLQTVLRTRIGADVSASDAAISVTDRSSLSENGTWPEGTTNVVRIGSELLTYEGISRDRPFTLLKVKRGQYGTAAAPHLANEELVKLQLNCYHGFCPDMKLLLDYADYYANVMNENGMQYVDFDGLESTLYQNQGYFAVRKFFRRLFDTYSKVSGGKYLRVMGSSVPAGAWEYMSVCNVGGGNNMFDPIHNQWGIEGKDIRLGFSNSYFPATFGIQDYKSDWSVYDAENLQAKSIGGDAMFMLGLNQESVEASGEKEAIFKAFRTWENARSEAAFTPSIKLQLRDLASKFHLVQTSKSAFLLYPIHETRVTGRATNERPTWIALANPYSSQALDLSVQILDRTDGILIALPDGLLLEASTPIEPGQFVIVRDGKAYVADKFRRRILDLTVAKSPKLQRGQSRIAITVAGSPMGAAARFELTASATGPGQALKGKS